MSDDDRATIPLRREAAPRSTQDVRLSGRTILVGVVCAGLLLVAVIVGLQVFVAEKIPDLTEESFQAAYERWQTRGPASYDLDLQIGGAQPGVVHVEVRNGGVRTATRDGLTLQEWNRDEWSVPGQFEMLEREFEFAEDPQAEMDAPPGAQLWLRCDFDPQFGYPRHFHRYVTGGAPEVWWRTTSFKLR
jgi:hypothetical protein